METQLAAANVAFRAGTPEEIAYYEKPGRVKLEKFIPLDNVKALLSMAKNKMGGAR